MERVVNANVLWEQKIHLWTGYYTFRAPAALPNVSNRDAAERQTCTKKAGRVRTDFPFWGKTVLGLPFSYQSTLWGQTDTELCCASSSQWCYVYDGRALVVHLSCVFVSVSVTLKTEVSPWKMHEQPPVWLTFINLFEHIKCINIF